MPQFIGNSDRFSERKRNAAQCTIRSRAKWILIFHLDSARASFGFSYVLVVQESVHVSTKCSGIFQVIGLDYDKLPILFCNEASAPGSLSSYSIAINPFPFLHTSAALLAQWASLCHRTHSLPFRSNIQKLS